MQRDEIERAVRDAVLELRPQAVVIYKGAAMRPRQLREIQSREIPVINVFPDYSPHAYGSDIKEAMGLYDLVISTKPFHPHVWHSLYGYNNPCVFVPHGYDPTVHLWMDPSPAQRYDVAMCCSWRPEYGKLMRVFAEELRDNRLSVAIAGSGWPEHRKELPEYWELAGPKVGRAYGQFLRSARIAIAPVNREVIIEGVRQPGDEDTTRTYELAAAYCFFLHQRTEFVRSVYDEEAEVPLWHDAVELVGLVQRWLPDEMGRRALAARSHARAVPAYSIPERAKCVLSHIERVIELQGALGKRGRE
jgi:spore maturation protein CgeB